MYKKGTGNDKQRKDAGNRTICPYRNFSQAINGNTAEAELIHCFVVRSTCPAIFLRLFASDSRFKPLYAWKSKNHLPLIHKGTVIIRFSYFLNNWLDCLYGKI